MINYTKMHIAILAVEADGIGCRNLSPFHRGIMPECGPPCSLPVFFKKKSRWGCLFTEKGVGQVITRSMSLG